MMCKSVGLECGDRVGILLGYLEYDAVKVSITSTRTAWMNLGYSPGVEQLLQSHSSPLVSLQCIADC